jgi:FKBP-type peptidyl-prolyl cis-trans isomerase FkpA
MSKKTLNIKFKYFSFWMILALTSTIISCSSTDALIVNPDLIREDSITQSGLDNDAIDEYIATNSLENVFTTESGVRYVFLKDGNGETPNLNDIVSIDYIGKLLNDEVFDASNKQDAIDGDVFIEGRTYSPIRFNLTTDGAALAGFVSGFQEGVTKILLKADDNDNRLMTTGGRALILIPSVLAYGIPGTSNGTIPANTVIAFEISLVSVRP